MIAHFFSILRIILGFGLFFANTKQKALLLFLGGSTDFLDGYFARLFQTQSQIGKILDPAADKLFITCLYSALVIENRIPLWVFLLFLSRDFLIVGGYFLLKKQNPSFSANPSMLSKFNTGFQMWYPFSILVQFYPLFFLWCAVITTILSSIDYLLLFKKFSQ